jgi:hypothetical protein
MMQYRLMAACSAAALAIGCGASPDADADADALATEAPQLDLTDRVLTSWDGSPAFVNADGIAEVAPLPEAFDPEAPLQPHVIARLEVDGYSYEFVRLFVEDDASGGPRPSTLLRSHGSIARSNPVHELQRSVGAALTFAEIYTGLTGQAAPEELQSEHAAQARRLSRVEAFQRAVRVPSGVIDKTTDADFTPAIPGHRYEFTQTKNLTFCSEEFDLLETVCPPSNTNVAKHYCTGSVVPGPDGFGLPAAIDCPNAVFGQTEWVRSAFYVPVGNGVTAQECYGPSTDGEWACFPAFAVSGSDLYTDDWDANARHTIGTTLSRLEAPATTARARTFWAHIVPL